MVFLRLACCDCIARAQGNYVITIFFKIISLVLRSIIQFPRDVIHLWELLNPFSPSGCCLCSLESWKKPATRLNIHAIFTGTGTSIRKMRRSCDRLIFIMVIPILVGRHLYVETPPGCLVNITFIFDATVELRRHLPDKYERNLNIVITLSPIVYSVLCMDVVCFL